MDPYVQEYHAWKARFALTNPKSQQPTSAHAILWCLSRHPDELNTMSHFLRVASLHHTSIQEKCKEMRAQKVIEVVRVCGATRAYVYALHASVRPSATTEEVDCSSIPRRNAFLSILEYLRRERESEGGAAVDNTQQQLLLQQAMALDTLSAQRQPAPLDFVNSSNSNNNNNNNNNNNSSSSSANTSSFNSAIAAAAAAVAANSALPFPSPSSLSALLAHTSSSASNNVDANAGTNADSDITDAEAIHADTNANAAVKSSIAIVAAAASADLSSATTTSALTPPHTNTQSSSHAHAPSSSSSNVDAVNMSTNANNSNINSIINSGINAGAVVPLAAEHFDRSLREHMQRRFAPHFDAATDALKVSRYALTVNSSERLVFQRVLEILQKLEPCGSCWLAPNELMHKTVMEIKSGITRSQMKKLTSFAWEGAEAVVVRHDPLHCESSSEHSRCCRPSHLCFGPKSAQQRDSAISAALRIQRLSSRSDSTNVATVAAVAAEVPQGERDMTTVQREVLQEEMNVEGEEACVSEESDIEEVNGGEDVLVVPQIHRNKRSREEEVDDDDENYLLDN